MDNVPVHINDLGRKPHANGQKPKRPKSKLKVALISVAAVVLLAGLVVALLVLARSVIASPIDNDKYQAVFLSSGQVYFGKLDSLGGEYSRLTDVFYIQATESELDAQNPQDGEDAATDLQLIKLGNEVHGPEDEMLINDDQILFVENLKADGKVSDSIRQYYNALNNNN